VKAWAAGYPHYWRQYRKSHPEYRQRDNRRRWRVRQGAKRAAKRNTIREISLQKLREVQAEAAQSAAKRNTILRATEGILNYLFWKEGAAKQAEIVLGAGGG
jgi:hypothetical protein